MQTAMSVRAPVKLLIKFSERSLSDTKRGIIGSQKEIKIYTNDKHVFKIGTSEVLLKRNDFDRSTVHAKHNLFKSV